MISFFDVAGKSEQSIVPISSNKSGRLSRNKRKFCKNSVESTNLEVLLRLLYKYYLLPARFRNIDTFNIKNIHSFLDVAEKSEQSEEKSEQSEQYE